MLALAPLGASGWPRAHSTCSLALRSERVYSMTSAVTQVPAADCGSALQRFESVFRFETDCWDVHEALRSGPDFVLVDVRSPEAFAGGHLPQAVNIPHAKIIASRMATYPPGTVFVLYCAGPHCNGAERGALRIARLGLPVKIMIGGITGWLDEGFGLEAGVQRDSLRESRASARSLRRPRHGLRGMIAA
jgi:rhodanese-related sulfurtransferase